MTAFQHLRAHDPTFERILCTTGSAGADEAARQAAELAGAGATVEFVEAPDEAAAIVSRTPRHDLLVLPAGGAATSVLTRSPVPVLIARPPQWGTRFPESIVIAVDESPEAGAAARLGARLAAEQGALVALVATPEHDALHRRALEGHIEAVAAVTGDRPLILDEQAPPVPAIVNAARSTDASLIVIGSRPGRHEDSVSAQVARTAGCSVLVLRTESRQ